MSLMHEVAERVRQQETARRAAEFNHLCALLLRSNESIDTARQIAENDSYPTPNSVRNVLKAAQSFSDISEAQGFRQLAAAFLDSLAWRGVFDRMLGDMVRVQFKTPIFAVTTSAVGSEIEEGRPKAISRLELGAEEAVERHKAVSIVVLSRDQIRGSLGGVMALVGRELRKGVVHATDATFLAGITPDDSPSPIIASTDDPVADLAALLDAVSIGSDSRLFLIVAPDVAKGLATATANGSFLFPGMSPTGGQVLGMPAPATDAVPAGTLMLVDASGIAAAADRDVRLDTAQHACLEMDDAPADEPAELVSLWQRNLSGIKAERFFGWRVVREGSVAVVEGADYGGGE